MKRVAELLRSWASGLGLAEEDRARWGSVGYLHDALRDERPEALVAEVPAVHRDLPGSLLHGPAAAERLRRDGVVDAEILSAVAFHTTGDPGLGTLGRALYMADFLEPGREFREAWRTGLRDRMPEARDDVLLEIVRARIEHRLEQRGAVLARTLAFWNALVAEAT